MKSNYFGPVMPKKLKIVLKMAIKCKSKRCLVCLRGCLVEGDIVGSMEGRQGRVYLEYVKRLTKKFSR